MSSAGWKFMPLALILAGLAFPCSALDNPDAPDRVGEFQRRMAEYQANVENARSTIDTIEAYHAYEEALDNELNRAYRLLMSRMGPESKRLLRDSQREWIRYRDKEFAFIDGNWTRENFGSSFVLSRGAYRAKIVEQRVIRLLRYCENYQ